MGLDSDRLMGFLSNCQKFEVLVSSQLPEDESQSPSFALRKCHFLTSDPLAPLILLKIDSNSSCIMSQLVLNNLWLQKCFITGHQSIRVTGISGHNSEQNVTKVPECGIYWNETTKTSTKLTFIDFQGRSRCFWHRNEEMILFKYFEFLNFSKIAHFLRVIII